MGNITRREFLTVIGVTAGGGALAYAPDAAVKAFDASWGEDWTEVPHGSESWVTSLCRQCPGGCGIRVRLIGDRPVKIEGNPLHPVNRGKLCPKGQTGLTALNDPDRIKGPLKRKGERGAGQWQEISWEEAMGIVISRLKEIRAQNTHTLAVMNGESGDLADALFARFLHQFGSPNYIHVPSGLEHGGVDAAYHMQGVREGIVYDMEMANYIVSFGADLLQSFWSPVQAMNAFSYARRGKPVRSKIMQVESRYSITASKADEWIPAKPGTEGILALGMANFIIKEGLYDKSFVDNHTFGFEDWLDSGGGNHQGYKNFILQNYSPGVVSDITGIPLESILRLSKEFATRGPSLAIGARGDVYQQMAVHALNALVGSIDRQGGVLSGKFMSVFDLPAQAIDEKARKGLQMPALADGRLNGKVFSTNADIAGFSDKILQGKPYGINALLVYNCNPLFDNQAGKSLLQAMGKIPFIASLSPFMDETTRMADLVLPDHSYLEKWHGSFTWTLQGFPVVGVGKPVAEPRYNTGDAVSTLIGMAQGIGPSLARAFPWKNSEEALAEAIKKLYELNRGDLFAPEMDKEMLRELVRRGWRAPGYKNFGEFWAGIGEKGGWWETAYIYEDWGRIFRTPSRKFEFYSQNLKNGLERQGFLSEDGLKTLRRAGVEAQGDQLFLPHWEPKLNDAQEDEKDYPYRLRIYQPLVFAGSIHANDPYLQDINSLYVKQKWHAWAEIDLEAAGKMGVKDGDWLWVESASAKLKLKAKPTPGAMPNVVSIPAGLGHAASGRWAKGIGENARSLIVYQADPFNGEPLVHKTRVKIYKA